MNDSISALLVACAFFAVIAIVQYNEAKALESEHVCNVRLGDSVATFTRCYVTKG